MWSICRVLEQRDSEGSHNFALAQNLIRLVLEKDAACLASVNCPPEKGGGQNFSGDQAVLAGNACVAPAIWHVRS